MALRHADRFRPTLSLAPTEDPVGIAVALATNKPLEAKGASLPSTQQRNMGDSK
jgi:hypothetical protein